MINIFERTNSIANPKPMILTDGWQPIFNELLHATMRQYLKSSQEIQLM